MSGVDKATAAVVAAGGVLLFSQAGNPQIHFWIKHSLAQNYTPALSWVLTGSIDKARRFLVPLFSRSSNSICMQITQINTATNQPHSLLANSNT